ncbi:RICIN domain-containing protein, partial [Acinetobacter baumannii]|nr:RICIN domain-containing protein [Acinetobacter baumannii]
TIQNNKSKKYLDVKSASGEPKANLQQYNGNKTDAQKFKFYDSGDGKYYIKSKLGTVIDVA